MDSDQAKQTGQTSRQVSEYCEYQSTCSVTNMQGHGCSFPELFKNCPMKEAAVIRRLNHVGIYKRYHDCTIEKIEKRGVPESCKTQFEQVKEFCKNIKQNFESGLGVFLMGNVGTLKTTMAIAISQHWVREFNGDVRFITMSSLLDNIFSNKKNGNVNDFENEIRSTDLLILDDLGSEHTEGWVLTKVDSIISERYNRKLPIIFTSNLAISELKKVYSERITDRLKESTKIIVFAGSSNRTVAS